jgi:hypothetical protein
MRLPRISRPPWAYRVVIAVLAAGNLVYDFDFNQSPRKPVLLPTNPPTDSPTIPAYFTGKPPCVGCTTPPPAP